MAAFDEKSTRAAIERIPYSSTRDIEIMKINAARIGKTEVVAACDFELDLRGGKNSDDNAARSMMTATESSSGLSLTERIKIGFGEFRKADVDELPLLRWIHEYPGISFDELVALRGKGDIGLIIGHFVYERLGCFRSLIASSKMSDLIVEREKSPKGMCYRLRPGQCL